MNTKQGLIRVVIAVILEALFVVVVIHHLSIPPNYIKTEATVVQKSVSSGGGSDYKLQFQVNKEVITFKYTSWYIDPPAVNSHVPVYYNPANPLQVKAKQTQLAQGAIYVVGTVVIVGLTIGTYLTRDIHLKRKKK